MGERTLTYVRRLSDFKMAHEASITGLAWLPDGTVVSAAGNAIAFWDVAQQRVVQTLPTHDVRSLAVSRDGTLAVTACEEGCVHAWDLARRAQLADLGVHDLGPDKERRYVSAVGISADGETAVSAAYDRTLRIWGVRAGKLLRTVTLPDMAYGCAIAPDGTVAAAGGSDKILRIIDVATGEIVRTCKAMDDFMSSVAFSPDGRLIATTTDGPQMELWNAATGELIAKWKTPGQTRECGFYPDGSRVWMTGGRKVATYGVPSGEPRGELESPRASQVTIDPDGERVLHGGGDGRLKIGVPVAGSTGPELAILDEKDQERGGFREPLMSVAWSADGTRLLVVDEGGRIALFDAAGSRLWRIPKKADGKPQSEGGMFATAFSPSGAQALTGGNDDVVRLWNVREGKHVRALKQHEGMINGCAYLDETTAITAGDDRLIVWNLATGKPIAKSEDDTGANAIALARDGERVFAGGEDFVIRVHDLESLATVRTFDQGHTDAIRALAVTPDGKRIVSASVDQSLRVWDIVTGACMLTLIGHQGPVRGVDVFANGTRAISASSDDTLRVWDLTTGAHVATLAGHVMFVTAVKVSPDGTRAASVSGDGTVRVWDLTKIRPLDPAAPPPDATELKAVAFNRDGSRVYAGNEKGLVRVWDTTTGAPLEPLRGGRFEVQDLAVSTDGQYVATAAEQGAFLWAGGAVKKLGEEYGTKMIGFDDQGTTVVTVQSGSATVWAVPAGTQVKHTDIGKSPDAAALLPDGKHAVVGCDDKLKLISVTSGKSKFPQLKLPGNIKHLAVLSARLVLAAAEPGLALVDLETKKVTKKSKVVDDDGDARDIEAMAVTPDGTHAALVVGGPLEVMVVELAKLTVIARYPLTFADYPVKSIACGANGLVAISTGRGDVVLFALG